MLRPFLTHIEKLCKTTDKILLAVSGGMDSMVMLHLFHQAGFSIAVAHCNFQLRGEESDEDEIFVAAKCKKWGIPFHSIRFDTNNYAIQHGLSVQMAARELRYNWFHQVKEKENADWIATAHHLSDSVETVLLNLSRGTSLDGLLGIAEKNGFVIRPLLFATHNEITNYAAETGVVWREDRSNETDDYQRNFVRHQIVPKLKQINPAFEQSIAKMVERLSGDGAILTHAIEVWKKQFQKNENDKVILAKKGFEPSLDDSYNSALLWRLLRGFGFHFDQSKKIVQALNGQSGKQFLSTSHQLVVDREYLILVPLSSELADVTIEEGQVNAYMGNRQLTFLSTTIGGSINKEEAAIVLDIDSLRFPLTWRKWKAGDFFFPLGMTGRKKISDFLVDQKVSLVDKGAVSVLESAGEIAWVVGYRIDDRFKVKPTTEHVLLITLA
ncbi:MAG: tRNA lysidine(34) synthetase TilS [Cytophagales bacterium]|nr:tRNA lysidine(34) synthetase TilS [Cytophagales bacterium]MCA6366369.1 tRNA lysidine(34) synthetase TilS [Cytophagales bacterium]MCA6371168.1 tRNA lysidine(34) synthetase TilS [Cytophagales bacterium]MCA6374707.1 tRNA lysidine(34) synthetase TilS [Cytophagales bacterium]MCA6384576.1 tRNA lysidine(34) synthetase TilS [Cytophagales bacterium]